MLVFLTLNKFSQSRKELDLLGIRPECQLGLKILIIKFPTTKKKKYINVLTVLKVISKGLKWAWNTMWSRRKSKLHFIAGNYSRESTKVPVYRLIFTKNRSVQSLTVIKSLRLVRGQVEVEAFSFSLMITDLSWRQCHRVSWKASLKSFRNTQTT